MYGVLGTLEGKKPMEYRLSEGVKRVKRVSRCRRCCQRCGIWSRDTCNKTNKTILVLGVILGLPAFYMTLWLLMSPGLSTLAAHFHSASCTVASSIILKGTKNCTWSSCRQGCTVKEMYVCWQILVYVQVMANNHSTIQVHGNLTHVPPLPLPLTSLTVMKNLSREEQVKEDEGNFTFSPIPSPTTPSNLTQQDPQLPPTETDADDGKNDLKYDKMVLLLPKGPGGLTRLQSNAEGCGYESCEAFYQQFGRQGRKYKCYLSADGSMAVPQVDLKKAMRMVVLGMLPLVLMTVAIVILYIFYCPKKSKKQDHPVKKQEAKWNQARHLILREIEKKHEKHLQFDPILVKAAHFKNQVAPSDPVVKGRQTKYRD